MATREASDFKAARIFPARNILGVSSAAWNSLESWRMRWALHKDSEWQEVDTPVMVSQSVWSTAKRGDSTSVETWIQPRKCMPWNEWRECVKYSVREWCQGYEPGVLNVWVQSYLLRVIIVSVMYSLITALNIYSGVSINADICNVDTSVTIPTTSKLHMEALVMHGHSWHKHL